MRITIPFSIRQFGLYLLSGVAAATVDFGGYSLLLRLNVWYIAASAISGIIGFFTVFLLNKYLSFQKYNRFMPHLARYFLVECINLLIGIFVLSLFVEFWGVDEQWAKLLTMGCFALWNFFVYKFLVFV